MNCPACQTENDEHAGSCYMCGRMLAAIQVVRPGFVIDHRYEVVSLLGKGGMGSVYRATDLDLEETVALKVLHPHVVADPDLVRRFRLEVRLARKVRHRNVCAIHEYGMDGALHYLAMEMVDGKDFQRVVREQGPLPVEEAFTVSMQAADGLTAIHENGIIHRDLKTSNIVRDAQGVVRLTDFGIAKQTSRRDGETTTLGVIIGTPEYMSPEQGQGQRVDFRADIYSLGVVMFELFTGQLPFRADTPIATIFRHVTDAPPLDHPALPPSLVPVLARALAKSPDDRFATVPELLAALRAARARVRSDLAPGILVLDSADLESVDAPDRAEALRRIGEAWAPQPLLAVLAEPEAPLALRRRAAEALGRARDPRGVLPLCDALADPSPGIREAAAEALGALGEIVVADRLIKALEADPVPSVRAHAAEALGVLPAIGAIPALVGRLKDPIRSVRAAAVRALGALGWEPADDGRRALRAVALEQFDRVASFSAAALDPLLRALADEDRECRAGAALALKEIGPDVIVLLAAPLRDKGADLQARCRAAEILGKTGAPSALDALTPALGSPHAGLRAAAALALGDLAEPRAVESLTPLVTDPDPRVRCSALVALVAIRTALGPRAPAPAPPTEAEFVSRSVTSPRIDRGE